MPNRRTKTAFRAAENRQAKKDADVHTRLVELADGTGRLQKHLKDHPEDRRAMNRHEQRERSKGAHGW